jgi:ADP-ribose pyrophosphatase YjhB (NUDIX family)
MSTPFTPDFLGAYAGQVRVRVCGLLVHEGAILLTAHRGLLPNGDLFWSPPGGGWQFGESVQECLKREFREETGLTITPGRFLHLHEFGSSKLQALELFFAVTPTEGSSPPRLGTDPEHAADAQLLTQLAVNLSQCFRNRCIPCCATSSAPMICISRRFAFDKLGSRSCRLLAPKSQQLTSYL